MVLDDTHKTSTSCGVHHLFESIKFMILWSKLIYLTGVHMNTLGTAAGQEQGQWLNKQTWTANNHPYYFAFFCCSYFFLLDWHKNDAINRWRVNSSRIALYSDGKSLLSSMIDFVLQHTRMLQPAMIPHWYQDPLILEAVKQDDWSYLHTCKLLMIVQTDFILVTVWKIINHILSPYIQGLTLFIIIAVSFPHPPSLPFPGFLTLVIPEGFGFQGIRQRCKSKVFVLQSWSNFKIDRRNSEVKEFALGCWLYQVYDYISVLSFDHLNIWTLQLLYSE